MNSIIIPSRLNFASYIPIFIVSLSRILCALVFKIVCSFDMVLGLPVVFPLEGSIIMFLILEVENFFCTWELSLAGVSLESLGGLMVVTVEGSLVGL